VLNNDVDFRGRHSRIPRGGMEPPQRYAPAGLHTTAIPRRRLGAEEAHRPPRGIRRVFWNEDPLIFRVDNK
jgi:hypothetical protein